MCNIIILCIIWCITVITGALSGGLFSWVRGRRQAHNPTLAKILRLTYNRSCSHNRPQTAACNAVYSISRRALLITRLGEQLPRPRQVSMTIDPPGVEFMFVLFQRCLWATTRFKVCSEVLVLERKYNQPYLLGLLAKIKCSICSYQLNL